MGVKIKLSTSSMRQRLRGGSAFMKKKKAAETLVRQNAQLKADKERLVEEIKQIQFECLKLENANTKLKREKTQAEEEAKAASKEEIKAKAEQKRLMNIVTGLCSMEPNPLSQKQLFIQNKTLKLKLKDADLRVKLFLGYYEALENRYFELLLSREDRNLKCQLTGLEENYKQLKADYYLLKMKLR